MDVDGGESSNDVVMADDKCCKDTEAICWDSGDAGKAAERGEKSHVPVDLEDSVDYGVEPKVGMTFNTAKEAYNCYDEYARRLGFKVRTQRTNMNKADHSKIHRQSLVCSCEGSYTKIGTPQKRRENRRFDCKAKFEYKLVGHDKYAVIKFISEHSHDLVLPQRAHLFRSQKKIEFSKVGLIDEMQSSGLEQSRNFSDMGAEVGEAQHLVQRTQAGFFNKGDAQFLLNYFKQKKQENKQFFYSFQINEEGEINGFFFCDAKSRRDYGLFGDVVCFDATFRINNNNMVCALIVGINNHGQTILFGCGLLDSETTDAMVWLFTTFLEAMGGKKPKSIFTDHSPALANAIHLVFPDSYHGICLWHIYQNAGKQLDKFKSLEVRFMACIYDPETIEEFEQSWSKLLEDYGLQDNEWLQGLYELRKKWARVFGCDHFCAGITTTERIKSVQNFFKDSFGSNVHLQDFLGQYTKAMNNQHEKEREAENETQQTSPTLISGWLVEREAAQKYTKEMFYCFQEEFRQTIDQRLQFEKDDGVICTYRVTEMEGRKKSCVLAYNNSEQSIFCTCRNFEFTGILCSHALKLFRDLEYTSLPSRYYLKRWTRSVIDEVVVDSYGDIIPIDFNPSSTTHYNELLHILQRIVTKCAKSNAVFSLTKSALLELEAKTEAWNSEEERRLTIQNSTSETHDNPMSNLEIAAPKKRASSKPRGDKAENVAMTQVMTEVSNHQLAQESFLLGGQPSLGQTGCQNMCSRAQDIPPQVFCPVYNSTGSQEQTSMSVLPNDLFVSQQESSSQTHAPPGMSQGIFREMNFSVSSASNCRHPSTS